MSNIPLQMICSTQSMNKKSSPNNEMKYSKFIQMLATMFNFLATPNWDQSYDLPERHSPTVWPLSDARANASSTMSLRLITLAARFTALLVKITFGLQSRIRWYNDSAEKPAKTTCIVKHHLRSHSQKHKKLVTKEKVSLGSKETHNYSQMHTPEKPHERGEV
jgi:hypothetical protein